jgi:DNA-binding MarR family transcriptional regulator
MTKLRSALKVGRIRTLRSVPATVNVPAPKDPDTSRADHDMQHRRLLIGVAHHLDLGEPDCCLTALAVLSASRALRRALDWDLGSQGMSENSFIALVTLYAVEPTACTPDALAHDAEIELERMGQVLEFLENRGWVCQENEQAPGRPRRVHITEAGVDITILAVHRFLEISATLTGDLDADRRTATIKACAHIVRAVAAAPNEHSSAELHQRAHG